MRRICVPTFWVLLLGLTFVSLSAQEPKLQPAEASRLANLVLKSVDREYPNKMDHVLNSAEDLVSPKAVHPAFYGCYDWHSSVHGHWLLVRLLRQFPSMPEAAAIRAVFDAHLTPAAIATERAYLFQPNRGSFEHTYGWAWLLKLSAELQTWNDRDAVRWWVALCPLTSEFVSKVKSNLSKQDYPIRSGLHSNSAFNLSLFLDYAEAVHDEELVGLVKKRAWEYFLFDRDAPLSWEPNGEDFLSPSLEEAALMVRVLPAADAKAWLNRFIPTLMKGELMTPVKVSDRADPLSVHLDGLNLSRARCLYRLAAFIGRDEPMGRHWATSAEEHLAASLPHIASGNYEGEHWLGTFALLAVLARERS